MSDQPGPQDDIHEPDPSNADALEDPAGPQADPSSPPLPADPTELAEHGATVVPPAPAPPYGSASTDPAVAMLAGGPRRHDRLSRRAKIGWIVAGCAVVVIAAVMVGAVAMDWI